MTSRKAFKAHMLAQGRHVGPRDRVGDGYMSNAIHTEWMIWKAAVEWSAQACMDAKQPKELEQFQDGVHACLKAIWEL